MEERVCLKCGKIVNVDISCEKIFCSNCGNLVYENDNSHGYIKFVRSNSYFYSVVSLDCYINGKRKAVVANGISAIVPLNFGNYQIYVKYSTSFKSKVYNISIDEANKSKIVNVMPGLFSPTVKIDSAFTSNDKSKFTFMYILYIAITFVIFFILGLLLV